MREYTKKEKIYIDTVWDDNEVGFIYHFDGEEKCFTEWYSLSCNFHFDGEEKCFKGWHSLEYIETIDLEEGISFIDTDTI